MAKLTGFDPAVVAKFFASLNEFRAEIKESRDESRQEAKDVRQALAKLDTTIATLTEKLKSIADWQASKSQECLRHQAQTSAAHDEIQALRQDLERSKGKSDGLSLAWKIIAGAALLISTATGVAVAISKLQHG